ncbi:MAG: DsbA family protein [Chloracidobacterium sp.]|nr:DsbA family protein [Chloracidobacterium sp.]
MRKEFVILGGIILAVIAAAYIGSSYYRSSVQEVRKPTNTTGPSAPSGQLLRPDTPILGPADAKVTLVEFYDPECESCAAFSPIIKKILKDYDGKIRFAARYMPLHPNSLNAANLTEAAGEQGKFWQARELLFQKQPEWGEKHGAPAAAPRPDISNLFENYAMELGIDVNKMNAAIKENRYAAKIELDKKDGQGLGVRKTPQFFVNGRMLARFGEGELRALIDDELSR